MKIIIKRDAIDDEVFKNLNFTLDSVLEISDEANATEVVYMFLKAMDIEGFLKESVLNAFYNVALAEAEQHNIELVDEDDLEDRY